MDWFPHALTFMIPIVGAISLFSYLAVVGWAEERRKEREAYYRYEFRKKLVDAGEMNAQQVQDLMRYEYEIEQGRRRQGMVATGFVLSGVGLGLIFGLRFIDEPEVWMVGSIPLFIALALLAYALLFAPKFAPPIPPVGAFPQPGDE